MRVGGQLHAPAALPLGKRPGTHCTGGCVGPRVDLDGYGKSHPHRDTDSKYRTSCMNIHITYISHIHHIHVVRRKVHISKYSFIPLTLMAEIKLCTPRTENGQSSIFVLLPENSSLYYTQEV